MKVMELTLAYRPKPAEAKKWKNWVHQFFSPETRLALKVDKALIGGAQVSLEGRFFDFSLQKKIETYFSKNKAQINEIIQRVS